MSESTDPSGEANLVGETNDPNIAAVRGTHTGDGNAGVFGEAKTGPGVSGISSSSVGVDAKTDTGPAALRAVHTGDGQGVLGASKGNGNGVHGICEGNGFAGVFGESRTGPGVSGSSISSVGVDAKTDTGPAALRAVHSGNGLAGVFGGSVQVTKDLRVGGDVLLTGADVAEQFDVATDVPVGSVVCLDDSSRVAACHRPYDKRVAGIVSGYGDRKPALVLDRTGSGERRPVAVVGKAWCLAEALDSPIEVGDLLTTSARPGHAMAARELTAAFGAVIGKALTPLASSRGPVLVLVGLG